MKAIALLSGGLDSRLALKLIQRQGIEVHALHFASIFYANADPEKGSPGALQFAAECGVPVTVQSTTDELLRLVETAPHGRGSGMNPCIDCRIMQFRRAAALMPKLGASFVVTGEVLGQRPMSQLRGVLEHIERKSGLSGLVVRPLSAKLLEPSIPEQKGWVDREQLLGLAGRGRKPQIALAEELGVRDYPAPAGGCRLTEPNFAARMRELMAHEGLNVADAMLLQAGRHFRLGPRARLVVGRDEADNARIESLARAGDYLLEARDVSGPLALARGEFDEELLGVAARIVARYGKGKDAPSVVVGVRGPCVRTLTVHPAADAEVEPLRIG
jgi:tRNA-specific 2-thiouridylase